MNTAQALLNSKNNKSVWSVAPDSLVFDAVLKMAEVNIGAVLVMEGQKLVGIFSERDYARKGILQGRKSQKTQVLEVMTSNLITVKPETTLTEMMELAIKHRIRHLPVVNHEEQVVGVLSVGDIVGAVILDQKSEIEMLEKYVY